MTTIPIIKVRWLDAARSAFEWTESDKLDCSPAEVVTVGFLFKETDDMLVVVQSLGVGVLMGEQDDVLFALSIPKNTILEKQSIG